MKKTTILTTALVVMLGLLTFLQSNKAFAFPVEPLPDDNLIANPWFRSAADPSLSALDGWTDAAGKDQYWSSSQKVSNPAPDPLVSGVCGHETTYCGTAARLSTTPGQSGGIGKIGVDSYLYQVVPADSANRQLKFFTHWVAHTVNPAEVNVYGGETPDGPWTLVWQPFYQVVEQVILPPPGEDTDWLWQEYTAATPLVETTLESGYAYYKIEIHAALPDADGGFKLTGIYFTAAPLETPTSTPTPEVFLTPTPTPRLRITQPTATSVVPTATPLPPTATPLDPTATPITPPASPTLPPTATPTASPTAPPGGDNMDGTIHVGDLQGVVQRESSSTWLAEAIILVHDGEHAQMVDALVTAVWSTPAGSSFPVECTTDSAGVCTVSLDGISMNTESAALTVEMLSLPDYSYAPADNHDVDGDSDGTTVVVAR